MWGLLSAPVAHRWSHPVNSREQGPTPKLLTLAFICKASGGGLLSCSWRPQRFNSELEDSNIRNRSLD